MTIDPKIAGIALFFGPSECRLTHNVLTPGFDPQPEIPITQINPNHRMLRIHARSKSSSTELLSDDHRAVSGLRRQMSHPILCRCENAFDGMH